MWIYAASYTSYKVQKWTDNMLKGGKKPKKIYGPLDYRASIFFKKEQNQYRECN